jgi:hypothetical protein
VTEGVKQITWTSKQGIPPGAFQDFGLSVQVPGKAGDTLTFKALQTYSNGEIVRWIGPEGSDNSGPDRVRDRGRGRRSHRRRRDTRCVRHPGRGRDIRLERQ